MSDGHVDVEVETILRGEGNQTSNLVVTNNDCNQASDENLVADKMVATTIRTWWQTVSQWTGAPAWVALRGSNQGLAGWGFENRASPVVVVLRIQEDTKIKGNI